MLYVRTNLSHTHINLPSCVHLYLSVCLSISLADYAPYRTHQYLLATSILLDGYICIVLSTHTYINSIGLKRYQVCLLLSIQLSINQSINGPIKLTRENDRLYYNARIASMAILLNGTSGALIRLTRLVPRA